MKKIFSLLFGCLAAFIVSVSFSACGPKDQNIASSGDPLVGVWKWVYEDMNYTYLLTINNDNTGTLVVTSPNVSGVVAQAKFLWKYASKNIVQIVIESGEMPGLGSAGSKIDLLFEFYGSDKLVFTLILDPSKSFGPFAHASDPNQNPNQQQPQDRIGQVADLVEGIGAIVNTQTMSDGSTVSTDNKGNKITIDPAGNTVVVAANGDKTTIDNSINEDKSAPKDKWCNTRWISDSEEEEGVEENGWEDPVVYDEGISKIIEDLGFQISGEEVSKDSTVEWDYTFESSVLDIHTTTAAITCTRTKTHHTAKRTYYFTKYPISTQTVYNYDTKYTLTIEERNDKLWAVIYYEINGNTYKYFDFQIWKDYAIYEFNGYQTHSENEQLLSKTTETTLYNYRRFSETQLLISNKTNSYYLIEEQIEDLPFPMLEVYTGSGKYVQTFELQ